MDVLSSYIHFYFYFSQDLEVKSLLLEAYVKGQQELLYVVPFVAKVLESSLRSMVSDIASDLEVLPGWFIYFRETSHLFLVNKVDLLA